MSSKKPTFTPKMTKINVPILSNVLPVLSTLAGVISEPKTVPASASEATTSASAIAISNMPAKKRPLLGATAQSSDVINGTNRDSAVQSVSSDTSYEEDMELLVQESKGKKRGAAATSTTSAPSNKKKASDSGSVIIVPSSSSVSSAILDKYDKLSQSDRPVAKTSSTNSNVHGAPKATIAPSAQPKEKQTRRRRPKPTHEILPSSMPVPKDIIKMTKYFRKSPEGIVGITFANVDDKPVVETIDRALYPETHNNNGSLPHHIQAGDVVISINNLDGRFNGYDKLMNQLVLKTSATPSADDRASIKNSVTDSMAVVVLARPVY